MRNVMRIFGFCLTVATLVLLVIMTTLTVSASDKTALPEVESRDYTVKKTGEEYLLERIGDDEAKHIIFACVGDVLQYLGDEPASVYLDNVSTNEVIEIEGNIVVSGSLSISGMRVTDGAKLTLTDIEIDLGAGCIEVLGGSLVQRTSQVKSSGVAIRLGYVSASSYLLESGEVTGGGRGPALEIERGSAYINGGKISCATGCGIINRSTLYLSGRPEISGGARGIVTESEIFLSRADESFTGSLDVSFNNEFKSGTLTPVFLSVSGAEGIDITLYNANGMIEELSFFEGYPGVDSRDFLAVYKPYTVRFEAPSGNVEDVYCLEGELVTPPPLPERVGYIGEGWYTDDSHLERFNFGMPVTSDLTLYGGYRLETPTYTLGSASIEYDGIGHSVGFASLTHPLGNGIYSYLWIREDGTPVSREMSFNVKNVSDTGEYICKVTYTFGKDTVTFETLPLVVEVKKAIITPPTIPATEYTGRVQYPIISQSPLYQVSEGGFVEAGVYPVTLTLRDFDNYAWAHSGDDTVTVYFEIKPATNRWLTLPSVLNCYTGHDPVTRGEALFGEPTFMYSAKYDGEYSHIFPTAPGEYFALCTVKGTENYSCLSSEPISFSVLRHTPVALSLHASPSRTEYVAFDRFDPEGLIVMLTYDSGDVKYITGGSLSVIYQSGDCLLFGDGGVTVEYEGVRLAIGVTVGKAEYEYLPDFSDLSVIYDGKFHSIPYDADVPAGKDGILPTFQIIGGGTNAGEYTVTLRFKTESRNYKAPGDLTATLIITPMDVEATYTGVEFVYDGTPKIPMAHYTDLFGANVVLDVIGGAINAGEYNAYTVCTDPNYRIINPEFSYTIRRASYDMSCAHWVYRGFVYDGKEKQVYVDGLPNGVRAVGYSSAFGTGAGRYLASVTLEYDNVNYNKPVIEDLLWEIERAEYDLNGISFIGLEIEYDGEIHYPNVLGEMPIGNDGIVLEYSISKGVINAGCEEVLIIFSTESENYKLPQPVSVYMTVKPKGITVCWGNGSLEYDGEKKLPSAYSDLTELIISGGEIFVGTYTAKAESANPNYYVFNSEFDYEITKAGNLFITEPCVTDAFFGKEINTFAKAKWGNVYFVFFLDEYLREQTDTPREVGRYYAVAVVDEGENYLGLRSNAIEFEIIPIVAVGISVDILADEIYAFHKLTGEDYILKVYNNDGSELVADSSQVAISGDGDDLRFGEGMITFSYGGFSCTLTVSVLRADYDMSGVAWQGTTAVYSGKPYTPNLTGLPSGVTVERYYVVNAINAGEYILGAKLNYDEENYNAPIPPDGILTIEKKVIEPYPLPSVVYDGNPRHPVSESEFYYFPSDVTFTDAGIYTVGAVLYDGDNFRFSGDGRVSFTILPRTLEVRVSDVLIYLFERGSEPTIEISGNVVEGDDTMIRVYSDGDRLLAVTDNSNYRLEVREGRIHRLYRLSPEGSGIMWMIVLISIILTLLLLVMLRYRRSIILVVSQSRRKRQTYKEDPPKPQYHEPAFPEVSTDKEQNTEPDGLTVDVGKADVLITDCMAKTLVRRGGAVVTWGKRRSVVNVDTLSSSFCTGSTVDINAMKACGIIPPDSGSVKVLARGVLDKPLRVKANDFSLSAVKMIALTGGEAIKSPTFRRRSAKINKKSQI